MLPMAACDPNEAPSPPLRLAFRFAGPALICAVGLSAFRQVFGGGPWLGRLSAAARTIGGSVATGGLIGLRFCLLGC